MKKGKKAHIEKLLLNLLMNRSKQKKPQIHPILIASKFNSMPFVRLKTKKRGTLSKHKILYLDKERSERKAVQMLSKNLKNKSKSSFRESLERELENLASGKSSITTARNEFHDVALKSVLNVAKKTKN